MVVASPSICSDSPFTKSLMTVAGLAIVQGTLSLVRIGLDDRVTLHLDAS